MPTWLVLLVAGVVLVDAGLGQTGARQATPSAEATPGAVVREVLAEGTPAADPEDALQLVRYTIPAGLRLPAHSHPGMQVSTIESGTLLYTVVEGEAYVTRGDSGDVETITPASGETAIRPGDALAEPGGMVHFGRNGGDEPIVILTASLFEADEPPAILEATPVA